MTDFMQVKSEIRLQEIPDVINVMPRVSVEPGGGFLVADAGEGQIRRYSEAGRLQGYFGRQGAGPGEFSRLSAAARLPSRNVVAADIGGTITVFDSAGARVVSMAQVPLAPLYNLAVVDEYRVLATGRKRGDAQARLVHLVDLRTGRIEKSFFPSPAPRRGQEGAYSFAGTADVAIRGDTAAAIFALSDTVYLFSVTGTALGKVPFRSQHFRKLRRPMPRGGSLRKLDSWLTSFSAAARVFWGPDSSFYVTFYDTAADHELQWRLLRLSRHGRESFEITDAPKLLSVSQADSTLVFIKPGSDLPNVWSIAATRQ